MTGIGPKVAGHLYGLVSRNCSHCVSDLAPPCQTSCRSPEESLVKLGGSEVTRDVEVFEGEEAARIGIDVGAGEAVST